MLKRHLLHLLMLLLLFKHLLVLLFRALGVEVGRIRGVLMEHGGAVIACLLF